MNNNQTHYTKPMQRMDKGTKLKIDILLLLLLLQTIFSISVNAQKILNFQDAIQTAVNNYGTIRAKSNYAKASAAGVILARRDYLPDLNVAASQVYGTINGQNGPLYTPSGLGISTTGPALVEQNWNAAFGSLYLSNFNWNFFSFGMARERVKTAQAMAARDVKDWQQEIFQQEIKVAAAYLNLLAAQRLVISWQNNLNRADTFRAVVVNRALHGLNPGVDSSLANAAMASAKISLTNAIDFEQVQSNQLSQWMGVPAQDFVLDTLFVSEPPEGMAEILPPNTVNHPVLQWYRSRISLSEEQTRYYRTMNYPTFSLVAVLQTRGSGFRYDYTSNPSHYTKNYSNGVDPYRSNYMIGIGLTWNLTQPLRISQLVKSQRFTTEGLQDEYQLASQQVEAERQLSRTKIQNALDNYIQAPIQVKAASDAYLQTTVQYKNGLTTLVQVTQAAYALVTAETDRDIAYANVWQALLLQTAASGDFNVFINKIKTVP